MWWRRVVSVVGCVVAWYGVDGRLCGGVAKIKVYIGDIENDFLTKK